MCIRFRALVTAVSLFVVTPAAVAQSPMLSRSNPKGFVNFLAKRGLIATDMGAPNPFFEVFIPEERALQEGPPPHTERVGFAMEIMNGKCGKSRCTAVEMRESFMLIDYSSLPKEEIAQWNAAHANSVMTRSGGTLGLESDIILENGSIGQAVFDKHLLGWLTDFDEFERKYYRPDPGITRWSFMRVRTEPVPSYVDAYMRSLKSQ